MGNKRLNARLSEEKEAIKGTAKNPIPAPKPLFEIPMIRTPKAEAI